MSTNEKKDNVVKVPPRRVLVSYKGMHGWVEYRPSTHKWDWTFKAQFTIVNKGTEATQAQAEFEMKKFMEKASVSPNIKSVD
jgi:hypothetical protein